MCGLQFTPKPLSYNFNVLHGSVIIFEKYYFIKALFYVQYPLCMYKNKAMLKVPEVLWGKTLPLAITESFCQNVGHTPEKK